MIYIAPPYDTGKNFIYSDKFGETLDEYLKYTSQLDGEVPDQRKVRNQILRPFG